MANPIAFNALTMTVRQLVDCANTLRTLFELLDRDPTDEDVRSYVEQAREHMRQTWKT